MLNEFDVLVIGAGPAGYVAAIRASQLGLKTAIVDKEWLGGVCLNVGCIPSKSLLKNADIAHTLRERGKELGFAFENLTLDFPTAVKRSRQVSGRLVKGVGFLMKKNNVEVFMGSAKFLDAKKVEVLTDKNEVEIIEAKNIIIATGATPMVPPGWQIDGEAVVTYREAILQEKLPASVIVIGSGAIGVEFSTVWNAYGTEVTIVEMLQNVVPLEDEEVSQELEKSLKKRGIKVLTSTKVESVTRMGEGVKVKVSANGETLELSADQALVAIGFRPNTRNINLEGAGIKLSDRGFIEINDSMETNVPGIYAIGDVTGKLMLAHVGSAMGILCAEKIAGHSIRPLVYSMMPRATYCQPQVASFGLTEKQALDKGFNVKTAKFPFQANGKALGLGEYAGWVKFVVDSDSNKLLGAHLIGPEVTELLPELTLAEKLGITIDEIGRNVHAHPTISEALMETAHAALGEAIHM
ncbi:MAG TPA: dihydrolipoyl dehydrogenase [Anaerolineales bacterium]|nr:dihydrolipoyl dehydrogenase [Anaerolineales bacterium]